MRGAVDFDCNGVNDGVVAADINGDSDLTPLTATVDWPRLVFDGGGIGSLGASAPPQTTPEIEPPLSELLSYKAAIEAGVAPPPPTPAVFPPAVTTPVATPTPTTPGLATAPPARLSVACTLKPSSSVALRGRTRGRLTLTVRCAAAATVRLRATVTTTAAARHGKRHRSTVTLRVMTVHTRAGRNQTIAIVLPATVVHALTRHRPTSAKLRLDGAGVRTATASISRLHGRR